MSTETGASGRVLTPGETGFGEERALFSKPKIAIVPCAGFASRFLPAAKRIPKELFPVLDVPILQMVYEEIRSAGIDEIVFVINDGKEAIGEHFQPAREKMAQALIEGGKRELLYKINAIGQGSKLHFIYQNGDKRGNGVPVLNANEAGLLKPNEPFVVIWGDEIILSKPRTRLQQMMEAYERLGGVVISAVEIPERDRHKYGMAKLVNVPGEPQIREILRIVEKPPRGTEPSSFATHGAYILPYEAVAEIGRVEPTLGGEIYLMEGINALRLNGTKVYGCLIENANYCDTGSPEGLVITNIKMGLENAAVAKPLADFMANDAISFMRPEVRADFVRQTIQALMRDPELGAIARRMLIDL